MGSVTVQSSLTRLNLWRRIAGKARASESDVTDDAGPAGEESRRAGVQGRRSGDDVIHEHQVRTARGGDQSGAFRAAGFRVEVIRLSPSPSLSLCLRS